MGRLTLNMLLSFAQFEVEHGISVFLIGIERALLATSSGRRQQGDGEA
jgi:hypothetical protein